MKLVKPSFEILEQEPSYEGMLRHIERCGRTCYKSEDKITKDSAKKFVDMIINRGHTAVLEQGTVYLAIPMTTYCPEAVNTYIDNPYSVVNECNDLCLLTNMEMKYVLGVLLQIIEFCWK